MPRVTYVSRVTFLEIFTGYSKFSRVTCSKIFTGYKKMSRVCSLERSALHWHFLFTSRYVSVWSMVLKLELNLKGLKVKSSQCFFPSKKYGFLWKILVFRPWKQNTTSEKISATTREKLMSARENDRKITPVKSSVKIIAKLYVWKTNVRASRPSPPPPPTFLKNTLEFHWIFLSKIPSRTN